MLVLQPSIVIDTSEMLGLLGSQRGEIAQAQTEHQASQLRSVQHAPLPSNLRSTMVRTAHVSITWSFELLQEKFAHTRKQYPFETPHCCQRGTFQAEEGRLHTHKTNTEPVHFTLLDAPLLSILDISKPGQEGSKQLLKVLSSSRFEFFSGHGL